MRVLSAAQSLLVCLIFFVIGGMVTALGAAIASAPVPPLSQGVDLMPGYSCSVGWPRSGIPVQVKIVSVHGDHVPLIKLPGLVEWKTVDGAVLRCMPASEPATPSHSPGAPTPYPPTATPPTA